MKKRIFTLFFAAVFLMTAVSGIVPAAAAEEEIWTKSISAVVGANNVLTVDGTALTGSLTTADAPDKDPAEGILWLVEEKKKGYTVQSLSNEQYLNLSANGVSLSEKAQYLTLTVGIWGSYIQAGNYYLKLSGNEWAVTKEQDTASQVTFLTDGIREYDNAGQEPLYTVACFSDLHVDYGIQDDDPPIRPSTQVAVDAVKKLGGADVMLVGGDIISANDKSAWSKELFEKVKDTIYTTLAPATTTGNVLMISGNHDMEPGFNKGDKYYSAAYDDVMLDNVGEFTETFYATELENPLHSTKHNELLCYRYSLDEMEFIGINNFYNSEGSGNGIYAEQITWVTDQMTEIGRDKTVIIFCHYPTISSPDGDKGGNANSKFKTLLGLYPNIIYCYGHAHDGNDMTWYNTSENVVSGGEATLLDNGAYETKRYITCFMGSMGYYDTHLQPGGLTEEDPMVVQFLMIDFYADHITFKYYNCGETGPDADVYEMTSFTVMRDMWQLTGGTPSSDSSDESDTSDPADPSAGTDANVSSSSSATAPSGGMSPAVLAVLIVCGVIIVGGVIFVVLFLMKNKKAK